MQKLADQHNSGVCFFFHPLQLDGWFDGVIDWLFGVRFVQAFPQFIPQAFLIHCRDVFHITWEFEICYEETLPTPILFLPMGTTPFHLSAKGQRISHLRQLLRMVEGRHYAFKIKPPKPLLKSYEMHLDRKVWDSRYSNEWVCAKCSTISSLSQIVEFPYYYYHNRRQLHTFVIPKAGVWTIPVSA